MADGYYCSECGTIFEAEEEDFGAELCGEDGEILCAFCNSIEE